MFPDVKTPIQNPIVMKKIDNDYPLIPMKDIDDEARMLAVRWVESEVKKLNNIWDKQKLASDFMNYARRKMESKAALIKELLAEDDEEE